MATTIVNNYDTIEEWRLKTNELGVKIADLDNNLFTINVIASGNITAAGNIIGSSNAIITGNIIAANVLANVHYGTFVTNKPAINVLFNANITGSANLLLSSSGTNIITISANVADNSVTLGTHTVGDYVKQISSADAANIIVNSGSGEGSTPTVNLAMTAVTPNTYGNANAIASFTVSRDGRLTNASNILIDRAYTLTTGKPSLNLNFTGDVTGTANLNLTNENTNFLSLGLTIQPNSVALGTDTTGDYVQSLSSADTSNIIVNNGTGEGSTPTINLAMTAVTPGQYGNANAVSFVTVTRDGRITSASNLLIDRSYSLTTKKPSINLLFAGNIVGNANLLISSEGTNFLSISANVANDSVTLGTHTVGDYVKTVAGTSGRISSSVATGEGAATVIDLVALGGLASTQSAGNANLIPAITYDQYGRITGHSNVAIDRAYGLITNKPSFNVLFAGNIVGNANLLLSSEGTNKLTVYANVANDSVTLGTHTVGDFVKSVNGTTGRISSSVTSGENAATVIDLATIAGLASTQGAGNANLIPAITYDQYGRITGHSNISIDRNYGLITNKPSINLRFTGNIVGNANLTISSEGTNFLEVQANLKTLPSGTYPTGLTPGTYGAAEKTVSVKVDDVGRIISIQEQTITGVPITGDYVKTVVGGTSITVTGSSNPVANVVTVNHGDTSSLSGSQGGSGISGITVDDNGHVTGVTTATYLTSVPVITLGTGTDGNYTNRVEPGTMITVSGTSDEGNVITINHSDTSSLNGLQGGTGVASITVDDRGHVTAVSTATYLTSVPVITLGSGTDGNYTDRVVPGTMMTVSGTADEGNVITISHSDTSTLSGSQGGSGIASITVDDRGHVTAVTTATYLTSAPASSNVFSYFGAGGNTISQTNSTHSAINSTGFNFFAGSCAGTAITTGTNNIFFGESAGRNTSTGTDNFFAGLCAGFCNTAGRCNIFLGFLSGYYSTAGFYNTFVGSKSGYKNTSGTCNSFFGSNAGGQNTTAIGNSFFGSSAGFTNSTGEFNVFMGYCAGALNTTGNRNVFIGDRAGKNNVLGNTNVAVGMYGGYCNISGRRNIYLGMCSGGNVSTGNDNIIFGCLTSCVGLTQSTSNVIIMATGGTQALRFNNTSRNYYIGCAGGASAGGADGGFDNIAVGFRAGDGPLTGSFNTLLGNRAGRDLTSGCHNNFIGICSGMLVTTGCYNNYFGSYSGPRVVAGAATGSLNIGFGHRAAEQLTSGSRNLFIGCAAGGNIRTGNDNVVIGQLQSCVGLTASTSNVIILATGGIQRFEIDSNINNIMVGTSAGCSTSSGGNNNFVGASAGRDNTTGASNNFFGPFAGACNTSGCHNNFFGSCAGLRSSSANNNNFFGQFAGACNTTGFRNNFLGQCAGLKNTTGSSNFFAGAYAGCGNTTGTYNTFIGFAAGASNTFGTRNIFIGGQYPGYFNTTGDNNIFLGQLAGCNNTTGSKNIFMGPGAGFCNTTGCYNLFFGNDTGRHSATGTNNTFLGYQTGYCSTTANYNNFLGTQAGFYNTSGSYNNFVGANAGYCNTSGNYNNAFGRWAAFRNTTGCNNVFIGHFAGCCNTTGSNNLFFGCNAGVTLGCTSTESNRIVMGNPNHCLACIQIAWTTPSDIRDKCVFGPVPHGKSFLEKINPITFSFKNRETNELKETKKRYGFSAQEVLEAEGTDPVIVGTENPEKLGFTTDFIIPILVNAVKELTKDVEELRAEITELKKSR